MVRKAKGVAAERQEHGQKQLGKTEKEKIARPGGKEGISGKESEWNLGGK